MSTSTIVAFFALIITLSCLWEVWLSVLMDRQNKVIKESFDHVMAWMEEQEKMNAEFTLWMDATENRCVSLSARIEALETRLPEFEWEDPNG